MNGIFVAPEVFENGRQVSSKADVWSLGVILYSLIGCQVIVKGSNSLDHEDSI